MQVDPLQRGDKLAQHLALHPHEKYVAAAKRIHGPFPVMGLYLRLVSYLANVYMVVQAHKVEEYEMLKKEIEKNVQSCDA
jgi:hypothetical protein